MTLEDCAKDHVDSWSSGRSRFQGPSPGMPDVVLQVNVWDVDPLSFGLESLAVFPDGVCYSLEVELEEVQQGSGQRDSRRRMSDSSLQMVAMEHIELVS